MPIVQLCPTCLGTQTSGEPPNTCPTCDGSGEIFSSKALTDIETQIGIIDTKLDTLDERMDTLDTHLDTIDTHLDTIETKIGEL